MKPIIKIENLGKQYQIGGLLASYGSFRELIGGALLAPFKRLRGGSRPPGEMLWALRDINFDVRPGETLGLIGHNGAGKSTLLKILSRITEPTTGGFELYGRVGSLLEVGTGFHPDLTGRENVFLNGAILGIKRFELERRFDEIVAFSEIEKFIDTPVKYYSSGMYLRLAFAVAVHLDAEILIMDEVLAVGDVGFQQKCIEKMHEIRQEGRTILFVSHAMSAVTRLCERVILLERGRIVQDGEAQKVVNDYLGASWNATAEREWANVSEAPGDEIVRLRRVRVCDGQGRTTAAIDVRFPVGIEMTYEVLEPGHVLSPGIDLFNEEGVHLFSSYDVGEEWRRRPRPTGCYTSITWIPANCLAEGNLIANAAVAAHIPETIMHIYARNAVAFQMSESREGGDSARGDRRGAISGVVRPWLNWTTQFCANREAIQPMPEEALIT
ncbi:MAG: ABC transporter ATP-binding protein [Pyrinomonadaceae bacterium]|nr:ABC transporter ATP-binding protein [Pyrinomonadaceae bacterium]